MKVLSVIITCLFSTTTWAVESSNEATNRSFSSYQVQAPGSQPITIYEDPEFNLENFEPSSGQQFSQHRDPKYQITKRVSTAEYNRPDEDTHMISMKPFPLTVQAPVDPLNHPQTPSLLEQFLQQYGKDPEKYSDSEKNEMSQNLENYFDDMERKNRRPPIKQNSGWVSLDPVPTYSSAKIYKWNSNAQKFKPNRPQYSQNNWDDENDFDSRPSYSDSTYSESSFNDDRPYQVPPRPFSQHFPSHQPKPSYKPYNDFPSHLGSYNSDYDDERNFGQKKPWNDLIMDNRPSNFPVEKNHGHGFAYAQTGYKKDKKEHPETYPTSGNGRWVLVSTTKGHQTGRNQKSISSFEKRVPQEQQNKTPDQQQNVSNQQLKVSNQQQKPADQQKKSTATTTYTAEQKKRFRALTEPSSVSTVLHVIPGGDTKNITTHNGNVIEVARHSRAGRFGTSPNATRLIKRRVQVVQPQDQSGPVFAAVGAGLIPATLSLVAPMVLGRRRRREVRNSVESQIQREPPMAVTRSYM